MARPLRFAFISWGRLDQHEQPSKGPQPNATWESGQWIDCEESLGQVGADGSIGWTDDCLKVVLGQEGAAEAVEDIFLRALADRLVGVRCSSGAGRPVEG